jgi:hypothetical protein
MERILVMAIALALSGAALAQQYKWIDKDGRTRYGDVPPPGVKATPLRPPPRPSAPPPAAAASKGPMTATEKEAEFRKRQEEAAKAREKQEQTAEANAAKRENCERAQEYVRTIESGQRISRTDSKGERYFLDDAQRAQELDKARTAVRQSCD